MTISISHLTQKLLDQQMKSGRFATPDEAVRSGLEALSQSDEHDIEEPDADTQAAIGRAIEQSERGKGRPWSEVRQELSDLKTDAEVGERQGHHRRGTGDPRQEDGLMATVRRTIKSQRR